MKTASQFSPALPDRGFPSHWASAESFAEADCRSVADCFTLIRLLILKRSFCFALSLYRQRMGCKSTCRYSRKPLATSLLPRNNMVDWVLFFILLSPWWESNQTSQLAGKTGRCFLPLCIILWFSIQREHATLKKIIKIIHSRLPCPRCPAMPVRFYFIICWLLLYCKAFC